jgi:hypothetical protein
MAVILAVSSKIEAKTSAYFSQGQAIYNAQDRSGSQQRAVQDFLVQALTQAVGEFLSPSQMGGQFAFIQDKILNQPERYIESHQTFSEGSSNGLYRVTGQVTVNMDVLKKDLEQFDIGIGEARKPAAPDAPSEAVPPRLAPSGRERVEQTGRQPSRGITVTKQELFWAVAEKWDQQWYLPRGKRDLRGLFALSVLQEAEDFDWSLHLPETGSITVEPNGNVSIAQVISEAKSLGLSKAVVGNVGVRRRQDQDNSMEATLRILDVSTGKTQGEIRKTWKTRQSSDQDDAIELASLLIPQLDNLLNEEVVGERQIVGGDAPVAPSPGPTRGAGGELRGTGEWTVVIHSENPFAHLEELQNLLRERSRSMQVKGMEVGPGEIKMRLDGIDGETLSSLQGAQLPSGTQIQVDGVSQEARSITLSFGLTSGPQVEPVQ